jgi:hypothetical protein
MLTEGVRHIITANLLQAFSDFKGKLVSYTTNDGQTKKGILMPENWNPGEQIQDRVVVQILKALPTVKSITQNSHIVTNNGISIFRTGSHFKILFQHPGQKAATFISINKYLTL